jgi:hypothetical protein
VPRTESPGFRGIIGLAARFGVVLAFAALVFLGSDLVGQDYWN